MVSQRTSNHDLAEELLLDRICLEFEKQLRADQQPAIESLLDEYGEPFRSRLLEQLILLELDYVGIDDRPR